MMEQELNPQIAKLIEVAKEKQVISWDEISDILGQDFVNSPQMEDVLVLLSQKNIQVMEDTSLDDEDETDDEDLDDECDVVGCDAADYREVRDNLTDVEDEEEDELIDAIIDED